MRQGTGSKCGFCGRSMKAPLVRARGLGFCCNSCCKAYQALYPASKKEAGRPVRKSESIVAGKQGKAARKGKAGRKNGKHR